jgi:hypothetical protein
MTCAETLQEVKRCPRHQDMVVRRWVSQNRKEGLGNASAKRTNGFFILDGKDGAEFEKVHLTWVVEGAHLGLCWDRRCGRRISCLDGDD